MFTRVIIIINHLSLMKSVLYRRWKAVSALQHKFAKDDYGKSLACKVEHPAYSTGVRMATVVLDVLCECYELFDPIFQSYSLKLGEVVSHKTVPSGKAPNCFSLDGCRESTDCVIPAGSLL